MNNITYIRISNFVALNFIDMDNIEALLKEKGLTKTAFSDLLGIKKQNLNGLMKNPTLETIKKFASVLGVETWQLFANPEEIRHKKDGISLTCPHCGKDINLKIE
jgi:transcriptional regulator with XRE-family HTH domain